MKKLFMPLLLILAGIVHTHANNVQITNVQVTGSNLTLELSWNNSWNATNNVDTLYPNNWDAVWLFVKVQSNATNLWSHQNLAVTGHSVTGTTDMTVETQTDNVGVFVRRTNAGHGNISNASVTLALGALPAGTQFNFRVYGIEMVRIPAGNFYVGDGNAAAAGSYLTQTLVTPSNTISTSALFTSSPSIPAVYPRGANAFYAMKYEITNEQYADFLNTLTYDQQANFFAVAPNAVRKTNIFGTVSPGLYTRAYIQIDTPGVNNTTPAVVGVNLNGDDVFNDAPDGANVAQANLGTRKLLAYLDWSGLRPMTEMEYEKICRGSRNNGNPVMPLLNEYPWGTLDYAPYISTSAGITDKDQPTERFVGTVVNGRVFAQSGNYPSRVGIFAEGATGRAAAGAGFYGNMNLGDNVLDIVVSVYPTGVTYTGIAGDGVLDVNGDAIQTGWPGPNVGGAYGSKGSYYGNNTTGVASGALTTRVSYRSFFSTTNTIPDAVGAYGGRGVR